jgi:hypothetical protein
MATLWRWRVVRAGVIPALAVTLAVTLAVAGCGGEQPPAGSPGGSAPATTATTAAAAAPAVDPARIDPASFTNRIDNPYLPLAPGTRFRSEGTSEEGRETVVVEVTRRTRRILGVPTVVVRDTVRRDGQLVEDTFDWYAQDRAGNVWYFGEATREYEDGKVVSTAGSWEAGVRGAQPGIVMKARPQVGDRYRQEHYKGHAEDMAEVLSVDEQVKVPFGSFTEVVRTKDFTPLEPDVVEHKYYARGVGFVLEVMVEGGSDRLELVEVTRG